MSLLTTPKSILNLALFRIAFGCIMLWEVYRYVADKRIYRYWLKPIYHFTYEGFDWVQPWSGDWMYWHMYFIGLLAILIIVGLFYRVAAALFFLFFSYTFLLEQAKYLNHLYLVCLVSFLMIFIPANKNYSLDARIWKGIKTDYVPAWTIYLMAFQIGIAYFLGGVAKLNADWLIYAEPMKHWIRPKTDFPFIGHLFDQAWVAYGMSWSGLLLDLLAPILLCFRPTRPFMFAALFLFHLINDRLFSIGIFPWFMILATILFFPHDWFIKFRAAIKNKTLHHRFYILAGAIIFMFICYYFHRPFDWVPIVIGGIAGSLLTWLFLDLRHPTIVPLPKNSKRVIPAFTIHSVTVGLIGLWCLIQIIFPLRHYFIPGNVSWTEEGHRFSWHMKLRSKNCKINFFVYDPATKQKQHVDLNKILEPWQIAKMKSRPYMILQFAQYLQNLFGNRGKKIEIRVEASAQLNYRAFQPFIASNVDISKQHFSEFSHNHWILQLDESQRPNPQQAEGEEDINE